MKNNAKMKLASVFYWNLNSILFEFYGENKANLEAKNRAFRVNPVNNEVKSHILLFCIPLAWRRLVAANNECLI